MIRLINSSKRGGQRILLTDQVECNEHHLNTSEEQREGDECERSGNPRSKRVRFRFGTSPYSWKGEVNDSIERMKTIISLREKLKTIQDERNNSSDELEMLESYDWVVESLLNNVKILTKGLSEANKKKRKDNDDVNIQELEIKMHDKYHKQLSTKDQMMIDIKAEKEKYMGESREASIRIAQLQENIKIYRDMIEEHSQCKEQMKIKDDTIKELKAEREKYSKESTENIRRISQLQQDIGTHKKTSAELSLCREQLKYKDQITKNLKSEKEKYLQEGTVRIAKSQQDTQIHTKMCQELAQCKESLKIQDHKIEMLGIEKDRGMKECSEKFIQDFQVQQDIQTHRELSEELSSCKEQLKTKDKNIKDLEHEKDIHMKESQQSIQTSKVMREEVFQCQEQLKIKDQTINALKIEKEKCISQSQQNLQTCKMMSKEVSQFQEQLKIKDQTINTLKVDKEKCVEDLQIASIQNSQLQQKIQAYRDMIKDLSQGKEPEELKAEEQTITDENLESIFLNSSTQEEFPMPTEVTEELFQCQEQLRLRDRKILDLEAEKDKYTNELQGAEIRNALLQQNVQTYRDMIGEHSQCREQLQMKDDMITKLEAEMNKYTKGSEVSFVRKMGRDISRLEEQLNVKEQMINDLKVEKEKYMKEYQASASRNSQEISQLHDQLKKKDQMIKDLEIEIKKCIEASQESAKQKSRLEQDVLTLREVIEESYDYKEQLKIKDEMIRELDAEKNKHIEESMNTFRRNAQLQEDIQNLKILFDKRVEYENEIERKDQKILNLEAEMVKYTVETQENIKRNARLHEDVQTLREIIDRHMAKSISLKEEVTRLRQALGVQGEESIHSINVKKKLEDDEEEKKIEWEPTTSTKSSHLRMITQMLGGPEYISDDLATIKESTVFMKKSKIESVFVTSTSTQRSGKIEEERDNSHVFMLTNSEKKPFFDASESISRIQEIGKKPFVSASNSIKRSMQEIEDGIMKMTKELDAVVHALTGETHQWLWA